MKEVIILGGSGIGMIAASIIEKNGDAVVGFLNDVIPKGTMIGKYKQYPVIGTTDDLGKLLAQKDLFVFIAYVGLSSEKATYEKICTLDIPEDRLYAPIDKSAIIPEGFCSIGKGVLMAPLSQLSPDTTISNNCIMLPNSFVGHDSFLDRFAHIATNAVVGANVHVGKGVHVGSNATIREKIRIGDFSLIGAGAVVIRDVPDNAVVVGNPARVLRVRE